MSIEADNAKEEIKELVTGCNKCGLCNVYSPTFKILRNEVFSPRGQVIILGNSGYEKNVYDFTISKSPDFACPKNIKISEVILKARKVLVESKKELEENKDLINNLEKTGNMYGVDEN